ncbi:hypothetical protein [Marinivivus vitaminiproducens]|uniref:hypothetical protein n=1 Tax=Marinivivus vitaminiproducens TaxID=3035935 RepID=UPI0027A130C7|nr:hypothetical protein P4R82_06105 [Geminicoccaceae bacterium SCSIO 64248]
MNRMMIRCVAAGVLAAAGAFAPSTAGAQAPGQPPPDWPCVQRFVPSISAFQIWPGEPLHDTGNQWRENRAVSNLSRELAARRVSVDQAKTLIGDFAAARSEATRSQELELLFQGMLASINRERNEIISGIGRFTRGQRALGDEIAKAGADMRALPSEDVEGRQQLDEQRAWGVRLFDERESVMGYLCEQPVILEQRAFALARAISAAMAPAQN